MLITCDDGGRNGTNGGNHPFSYTCCVAELWDSMICALFITPYRWCCNGDKEVKNGDRGYSLVVKHVPCTHESPVRFFRTLCTNRLVKLPVLDSTEGTSGTIVSTMGGTKVCSGHCCIAFPKVPTRLLESGTKG